jgi:copper homeostasis protein
MTVLVEACVESVTDVVAAERVGAHRVELCANLLEGGTTPSIGMIRAAVARGRLPVFPIIRARGGDFLYSAEEIEVMLRDIEAAKAAGAHGIVAGALHPNGTIDEDGTEFRDLCLKVSIECERSRLQAAIRAVRHIGRKLDQRAMYLEVFGYDGVQILRI